MRQQNIKKCHPILKGTKSHVKLIFCSLIIVFTPLRGGPYTKCVALSSSTRQKFS